jgi:HSP20 family protein
MNSSNHIEKDQEKEEPLAKRADTMLESIRRNIEEAERAFARSWTPSFFELRLPHIPFIPVPEVREPLCDLEDRGDRYEMNLEIPGIEREKVDVKATKHSIEISGEQSEKKEGKGKNYLYNERSYKSFYRKIRVPEEIVPSKIEAKVVNGILNVSIPKKTPTATGEEETKVEVK